MINSRADSELFVRHPSNPLLTAGHWPYRINVVMNAGATVVDGTTVLLCRVEDRRGFSHLTVARSADGVSDWQIDDQPLLQSRPDHPAEEWGLEDARLTRVDELDCWVIAYTVYGRGGPALALATTTDFRSVERLGTVRGPEDKNGGLLARRVHDEFVLFHRPVTVIGARADIWLSRSPDLHRWRSPEPVMTARPGGWWDAARIGIGPPPIETADGWLLIYHGVRLTVAGSLYRVGLALLDLDQPSRVLARCDEWVLGPSAGYEQVGDVPGVVFPCGYVHDPDTDELRLYYGAADSCIGMASAPLSSIMDRVRTSPGR